jgi:hypothetical protein
MIAFSDSTSIAHGSGYDALRQLDLLRRNASSFRDHTTIGLYNLSIQGSRVSSGSFLSCCNPATRVGIRHYSLGLRFSDLVALVGIP